MSMKNCTNVVGAIIVRDDFVLLAQRACDKLYGKWEFPGGKVAPDETHQAALKREIFEELNLEIAVGLLVDSYRFRVNQKHYELYCYLATINSGEPVNKVHHAIKWVLPEMILDHDLAPPDIPIAKRWLQSIEKGPQ